MNSRRSLDYENKPKKRKLSKRFTINPREIRPAHEKENKLPTNFSKNNTASTSKQQQNNRNNKYRFPAERLATIRENNKALAKELGIAKERINEKTLENLHLSKLLFHERQNRSEYISREVNLKLQKTLKITDDFLQQTVSKLLECTKLISDATQAIHGTIYNPLDTTPPPDDPQIMEVTCADAVPMETTCMDIGGMEMDVDDLSLKVHSVQSQLTQLPQVSHEVITIKDSSHSEKEDDQMSCEESQPMMRRNRKRRASAGNVSYAMPSLRSKLRRGDPFTDASFRENLGYKDTLKKRKGRMSTGCIKKKSRYALTNLTNIIKEEPLDSIQE